MNSVVIVGAGQAGFQAAASLRDNGYEGRITLVGDEPDLPYERPPLSKSYLSGQKPRESLQLRPERFYSERNIELLLDEHVVGLDRANRKVALQSQRRLSYDHLIIATGARNRKLGSGNDLEGVFYVRTAADADRLRERLAGAHDVVIVGAGFIGLEIAAVIRRSGRTTYILDVMPRVLCRAVSPVTANMLKDVHERWGSVVLTQVTVSELVGRGGRVVGVRTTDGRQFPANLVVIGIGVVPNVELALAGGLRVRDGIVVNSQLSTSDSKVSAIGDCAEFPSPLYRRPLRLESVQNAVDQARCVAHRLVGKPSTYASIPWFWSDQNDIRLQIAGITAACDNAIIRGNPSELRFSVFCFANGRLLGIESMNRPVDHMLGRALLAAGLTVTPEQAGDMDFDLRTQLPLGNSEKARLSSN